MSRWQFCFEHVIGSEGGYVNDPADPGGETIYGIARRDHPDMWADGPPTLEAAMARYEDQYWRASGANRLPEPYDLLVFDSAVNQGAHAAVSILQRGLGIEPDGRVGPQTIAACLSAGPEGPAKVLAERALRYTLTRGFDRFGRGWLKRTYMVALACKT